MGDWLAKYGESIYGTRGGPFKPGDYGVSTRKGHTIYLHVLDWPGETLVLPAISAKVLRSRLLSGGKAEVCQTASGLEVSVAEGDRQPMDTVVALELDGPAFDLAANGSTRLGFTDHQGQSHGIERLPKHGRVWPGQSRGWQDRDPLGHRLRNQVRVAGSGPRPSRRTFSRAVIKQAFPELKRVRKFAIEYWQDEQWKACYRGENLGAKLAATFDPDHGSAGAIEHHRSHRRPDHLGVSTLCTPGSKSSSVIGTRLEGGRHVYKRR